jgi:propionyl-CoA carboxylase alpha chain/3-methylcrotonyl-CoA carboxylase alpha subunit
LLAKVIAAGETREVATKRLIDALRRFPILGVPTNISFLVSVLLHPRFQSGQIDTGFLDAEEAALTTPESAELPEIVRAAFSAHENQSTPADPDGSARRIAGAGGGHARHDPWNSLKGWRG